MSTDAIDLVLLCKAFGKTKVVQGLSLTVARGEFVSLLGPSGCGKTTTLRMIAGLEVPDEGRISIEGETMAAAKPFAPVHVPPERRRLGMVFQSYAIWPHKTVAQNVAYPLKLQGHGSAEVARRTREALTWVRMEEYADRMPHALSGGQLQRVALARALAPGPRVLLLDEPLSNLDAALREELRGELAALRARLQTTMVYVTHDQSEALALSDRVAVMNRGVLEQVAPPEVLYAAPASPFVASFVGGANLLQGQVQGRRLQVLDLSFELPEGQWTSGPATIAVRPEHIRVSLAAEGKGTRLPLTTRLFLGSCVEYRFAVGSMLLRAVGPALPCGPGETLNVKLERVVAFQA